MTKDKRPYKGVFTDTRNWDRFEHRPGDVFVCVPPKSGTTWMQTICGLLIFGDPDADVSYPEISPWIEFSLSSKTVDARLEMLATQTHRRFIKSHTPLDGIPYFEGCTYLACHRHPLDVHFSMWHHVQNMKIDHIDHLHTQDRTANFNAFLANSIENEGLDQPSLELITHHYETARARAKLPNVHLFHYATLSQDLSGQMRRIAKALNISHPDALFDALVEKATFKSMKANALKTAPGAKGGLYKDPNAFFNSGQGRKWDGILDAHQLARYRRRVANLLAPDDVIYLETGQC
ncbi:sulfotransferase domain-containing protein [Ascidiaceihabitans sp.]|uniref:sulfotransferase domain-containing protein n=1 Tax=Ascidiaceihabitans sp. TaxID=1872644 RepID=UPI0032996FBE